MTLADLNAADQGRFVEALGWVFEHSPWVAERAWSRRPFASSADLHGAMTEIVTAADRQQQLALLRAHPDLGTRTRMSDASVGEQAGAGLDRLPAADFNRLQALNRAYREKFGFPFLYAVKGSTAHDIMAALERRIDADHDAEFDEALRQVARIAGFRLNEVVSE
jgi:2-oxo-4-hydroxy-4-carboxy-5-ureidoimidazoline decarboxylase